MTTDKTEPVEIRIEENGGVRIVNMDAFFAQPKVKETLKLMKKVKWTSQGKNLMAIRLNPKKNHEE